MDIKKTERANLENHLSLFRLLGLVLILFTVYSMMEYKDYSNSKDSLEIIASNNVEDEEETLEIEIEQVIPPPPPASAPEMIEIVEDMEEIEETVIESTETDEFEKVEVEDIVYVEEAEEEIVEDVPFAIIENVPVYPGCEKEKGREAKKNCLNRELQKHVAKYFDVNLAANLGLTSGKIKIYVQFKIMKTGLIEINGARAPHKQLESEARKVVKLLPKMTPGTQRGIPVNVTYMLPITFEIR